MKKWYDRLESFKELEIGWSYPGDLPPDAEAFKGTKEYLEFFEEYGVDRFTNFFFYPCNDGGIEFEIEVDWDGGRKGIMFSVGGDESDQIYMYEETSPDDPAFNVCWDYEGNWKQVESGDGTELEVLLVWLMNETHSCNEETNIGE